MYTRLLRVQYKPLQTTAESFSVIFTSLDLVTYRIANIGRGNNVRVQEDGEQFNDGVNVKEQQDLLSSCVAHSDSYPWIVV